MTGMSHYTWLNFFLNPKKKEEHAKGKCRQDKGLRVPLKQVGSDTRQTEVEMKERRSVCAHTD
ncbi:hypothetical protein AAY473_001705 [Plecturocebus cupreus]